MPLRDHFRPPLSQKQGWDGLHGGWPMVIVQQLFPLLPPNYFAMPDVHLGALYETDVGTFEDVAVTEEGRDGVSAVATYAPPKPTHRLVPDLTRQGVYEVRVYDTRENRRLVAAIEIVSPSNKDRPSSRAGLVSKVTAMLDADVCVMLVDVITSMDFNLYADVMAAVNGSDPSVADEPSPIYAATLRTCPGDPRREMETWYFPLSVGEPLPKLPLWLNESRSVPVDLEASYESTCRPMGIR